MTRKGRLAAAALLFVSVAAAGGLAHAATSGDDAPADALTGLYDTVAGYSAEDYTAASWSQFAATRSTASTLVQAKGKTTGDRTAVRTKLQTAADGLVMVRGLKSLVADYRTRPAGRYTSESSARLTAALDTAAEVAANPSATASQVATAKTALTSAAGSLVAADEGTFQTITNNTFWNDTSGNPIYSQGGGVFKFGDTYYWYGVHYLGAEHYRTNPTKKFDNEVTFVAIPVYSSKDLVNWKFERNVATTSTTLPGGGRLGGWVGRLGVSYNENTGKYVLVAQGPGGVVFLRGDSPTDTFDGAAVQGQIVNSPTPGTGDQTIFTDDNGKDYLIFSNASGRSRTFVAKLRESDSLAVEPAVEIAHAAAGREGNAMFKLDGKYYAASSDLHGWNSSVTHVVESTTSNIQGAYTTEYTMQGTELDYSHVTQTGFFVTVNGTKQRTVIFAGDRWADFAWNGIGYNQWMPVDKTGSRPQFHSLSQWQFNATTGEWRVGPQNNYILNPEFAADRITTTTLTGWTNFRDSGPTSFVTNVAGANGTRFALQIGAGQAYSGGVRQQVTLPAGTYTLATYAKTSGSLSTAQVTVTDATGAVRTLSIPASSGWTRREATNLQLAAGTATITVKAASGNGYLSVDGLSLVKTSGGTPQAGRYEAETAPAVCQGTIDSDRGGFSGSGYCNGNAAVGAYAQFTVNAVAAGTATVGIRWANGATSARPANVVVNGATVTSGQFASTGAWNTWSTTTVAVPVNAGSNTIRIDPTTANGLPNIDYLDVSAG
ncbi:family 43 glycosylhydrolase [Dactylosporangium aurantiacum]|uniref:Family 43 glycosylhydrolase n=2 Tax=Dactylosporangium aurantiacum TaxID=35754 RepID=A0A9Q9INJ1_9ACTN|nr:CBM35 domain-containing protein [Dactylosporangium aurantiacum]UWZ58771.1 family 43 glycosylhydrolase [Dactylosporangium aurantiacum]